MNLFDMKYLLLFNGLLIGLLIGLASAGCSSVYREGSRHLPPETREVETDLELEPKSIPKTKYRVQLIRNLNFDAGDPPFYLHYTLDECEYQCTFDNYVSVHERIQHVKARGGEILRSPGQVRQIDVRRWEQRIITEL